jgi:NAD(P)-dependent dehydrogenase (short-subunit alcohol dehydrogenase family)
VNQPARPGDVVLVTGASRGLGRHIATHLAAGGLRVVAGVRDEAAAADLATVARVVPMRLDVTDPGSVAAAARGLAEIVGSGRLAGVVNNAGTCLVGAVEELALDDLDAQLRVNVLGPVAVTQAVLPLLRAAQGRVVNVSSVNGRLSVPFWGAYCASKAALEALSDALRLELAPAGVAVAVVQPGAFDTDIRSAAVQRWIAGRADLGAADHDRYADGAAATAAVTGAIDAGAADPAIVAQAVLRALTDAEPRTRYAVGDDAEGLLTLAALNDASRDAAITGLFATLGAAAVADASAA